MNLITSHLHLNPSHARLQQQLTQLCDRIKETVSKRLRPLLSELQVESGLKLIAAYKGGCPQEVLLLPPRSLARIIGHSGHPQLLLSASGQIDALLKSLSDERAEALSELLEMVLEQLSASHGDHQCSDLMRERYESIKELFGGELEPLFSEDDRAIEERSDKLCTVEPLAIYCASATWQQTHDHMKPDQVYETLERARPHIEYYALRLLACAWRLPCGLDALTRVVRVHELSHLVTHLGLDCAERHWHRFHHEGKHRVEGSAQELTQRHLERDQRSESATPYAKRRADTAQDLNAFHKLNSRQSYPYRAHLTERQMTPDAEQRRADFNRSRF